MGPALAANPGADLRQLHPRAAAEERRRLMGASCTPAMTA